MSARADAHVAAFNDAVRSSGWDVFAARFAGDARMEFVGVPVGPFSGPAAIAAAYRADPPDDTMTTLGTASDGEVDVVRFAWDHGGTGTMRLSWTADGEVAGLSVAFD
jgi:steroid Delta-isomerase